MFFLRRQECGRFYAMDTVSSDFLESSSFCVESNVKNQCSSVGESK